MESAKADATIRVPPNVVFRRFVSETVVLNLATGKYHGLNPDRREDARDTARGRTIR